MKGETGGDPISGVQWSRKSTAALSRELTGRGHSVSDRTVSRLLQQDLGYSLKANVKELSGKRHPQRERQFQQIGRKMAQFQRQGLPVLSVDTKKKELIGPFYNAGRTWREKDKPIRVSDHDFPSDGIGKAVPYGIYDVNRNRGLVVVGTSVETSGFGVDALRAWYRIEGHHEYPDAEQLLVLADNGGCNGSVNRQWKYQLQRFANQSGLSITVLHYPPGASKWNPVEHRLFGFISQNWAGIPLFSYETVLKYIRTTQTQTGLKVRAVLHPKRYEAGVKISEEQMATVHLRRSRFLPKWSYTIRPAPN